MSRRALPILLLGLAVVVAACSDDAGGGSASTTEAETTTTTPVASSTTVAETTTTAAPSATGLPTLVFNGQGNDLAIYDADTGAHRILVTNAADDPTDGRDINGQICFFPEDPDRFIAGEDTGQPDPPAGWGVFRLEGDTFDQLTATQIGKLTPTYQPADDQPENYGCGFLPDGRLLTTDIGNQAGGAETGQLIVWFPPLEGTDVAYCKIDVAVATALGIEITEDDSVLVASSRGSTPGIVRFAGDWPTGPTAAEGCGRTDATGAPLVDEGRITRSVFVPPGNGILSAAAVAGTPEGTYLVSSSITGVINEYGADGSFLRTVLAPPEGTSIEDAPYATGTPQGIGVGPDGSIFYADLGIVVSDQNVGPGRGTGGVWKIPFADGRYGQPDQLEGNLSFPDGIGIRPGGTAATGR